MTLSEATDFEGAMSRFPFEEAHRAMVALNWKWITADGCVIVPSIERMKEVARGLGESLEKDDACVEQATGGFSVVRLAHGRIAIYFGYSE